MCCVVMFLITNVNQKLEREGIAKLIISVYACRFFVFSRFDAMQFLLILIYFMLV